MLRRDGGVSHRSGLGLGRVKTFERAPQVERFPSPLSNVRAGKGKTFRKTAAGRTRFPSVNALSEFSHGLGHELPFAAAIRHAWMTPVSRPHHETSIRRQSNTSAIPPIPTASEHEARRLLCASRTGRIQIISTYVLSTHGPQLLYPGPWR